MDSQRFQYYAFISYSHKDEKWARWLQKKLENYKLPNIIRKESDGRIPAHIRPIFRDQTDLGLGNLQQSLRQELVDSRYLIIIATPNSAKSEWVDKEIRCFQELGRGERIIPFIVAGSPNAQDPEEQCYPPALLDTEDVVLGASLQELKPEEALIKVVAAILGLKYDQLYDRHQRREKKKRRLFVTAMALFLIVVGASSYAYWDYSRIKVENYAKYVERWGIPTGIIKLNRRQIRSRSVHYRFEYQRGKLRRVISANSVGVPTDNIDDNPMIQGLHYADNRLEYSEYLNRNGRILRRIKYSVVNPSVMEFKRADKYETAATFENPGSLHRGDLYRFNLKNNISRCLVKRDRLGRIIQILYMRDNYNMPTKVEGISGQRFFYNKMGLIKEALYIDEHGNPYSDRKGIMGVRYEYDSNGNAILFEYFDKSGKPAFNKESGFAMVKQKFDHNGNAIMSQSFDANDQPASQKLFFTDKATCIKSKFDRRGFLIKESYYDKDGKIILSRDVESDSLGNQIKNTFMNNDGIPCMIADGFAIVRFQHDDCGNLVDIRYFNAKDQPCLSVNGFAEIKSKYDKYGNCISFQFYDTKGKPCIEVEQGYAGFRYVYDEAGEKMVRVSYFGIDGKPCFNKRGYAGYCLQYNEQGNISSQKFLDCNGHSCLNQESGYAEMRMEYDTYGRRVKMQSFGKDGKLCIAKVGLAEVRYIYDEKGNEIEESYWGKKGERILANNGYAKIRLEYDTMGNVIERTFYGINNQLLGRTSE